MVWLYSHLDSKALARLQLAEKELGITLLAFEDQALPMAQLDDAQLNRVQELEKDLGVVLLGSVPRDS